jgi:hypothetical protein
MDQRLHGLFLPFQRSLADPRQPRVRAQPDEEVIPDARVGKKRLQGGDFHNSPSGFNAGEAHSVKNLSP